MAERRMFSKAVINSARFLTMPPSSRLLYYDLGMAADDDGIVEAFTVIRTTGAVEDGIQMRISEMRSSPHGRKSKKPFPAQSRRSKRFSPRLSRMRRRRRLTGSTAFRSR